MSDSNTYVKAWDYLLGFEPVSLSDWPGKVSAVLFFGGCNLRCPTCHNASIAWNLSDVQPLNYSNILRQIQKNKKWLDGLVLTGGEVTILPGLEGLFKTLSAMGLPIKIDTNGLRPGSIKMALKHENIRKIAVDVKGPWEKYPHLCGGVISTRMIRACAEKVFQMARLSPEKFIFRCTRVPGLNEDDMKTVRSYLPEGFELNIQKYVRPGV